MTKLAKLATAEIISSKLIGKGLLHLYLLLLVLIYQTFVKNFSALNLGKHGPEGVEILPLDLSSGEDAIREVVEKAISLFAGAGVDYVIHNAAFERPKSVALDVPEASLKATLDVNVVGPGLSYTITTPSHVKERKRTLCCGKAPAPGQAVYSASKFILKGYFHSLRSEFYQKGIMVTVFFPGPIETTNAPATSTTSKESVFVNRNEYHQRVCRACLSCCKPWFERSWISYQPVLAVMYLVQYMLSVGFWLMDKVRYKVAYRPSELLCPLSYQTWTLHLLQLVLHPNQIELISGDQNGDIRVWDLTTNSCSCELVPEVDTSVRSLTMMWDGSLVVAANNKGTCYVWRLLHGTHVAGSHLDTVFDKLKDILDNIGKSVL
ncbi:unnamed protein product [Lactuca virosa]|uniref:Uncharacterized protein n=1 Tax=Lactuca virosa TaxID=75947 RepID=A0AAU9M992_9ASTR|nr:unnamed protein product [Lactuca virosa]